MFEWPNAASPEKRAEKDDFSRRKVLESIERTGKKEQLSEAVIDRLVRLEKMSPFNEDARMVQRGHGKVLDFMAERHAIGDNRLSLSREHRQEGSLAALLHDTGKSGPVDASPEQQEAIIKVFALEEIRDGALPVAEAVKKSFATAEAEEVVGRLAAAGIDPQLTMRQFWNLHAQWTHDILERYPDNLTEHTRVIAGSHHIDHGINPYGLPEGELPLQASLIGTLEEYVDALQSRVLIAVDQYEASIRRSHFDHAKAIGWVRQNLEKFKNDPLMASILDAVDELGKKNALFAYDKLVEPVPPRPKPKTQAKKGSEGHLVFYN